MHILGWILCVTLGIACLVVYLMGEQHVTAVEQQVAAMPAAHDAAMDAAETRYREQLKEARDRLRDQLQTNSTLQQELKDLQAQAEADTAYVAQAQSPDGPAQQIAPLVEQLLDLRNEIDNAQRRLQVYGDGDAPAQPPNQW